MAIEAATPYEVAEGAIPKEPEFTRALADYRKMFDDYRNTAEKARQQSAIDIDYYHGKQLTTDEKRILSQRGQPDIVINRVRTAVNGVLGVIINATTDPRCFPRTPNDGNSSDVATDCLRYVTKRVRWPALKGECFFDLLVPGVGAAIVEVDDDKEVDIVQIRWEEFFYDPRSRRRDFKDAKYMGIARWRYSSDVEAQYKGKKIELSYSSNEGIGGAVDSTFEDRPMNQGAWLDARNRRVMVVELYHQYAGKWHKCVFYGGGVLEESVSPYLDDKGRPCCPIEAMTGYIDRDNDRYGIVRDMIDIQDEINKRRSKLLHLVNSHQIQARDPSAIEVDADTARKEAARPDGVIPYGWEVVRTTDMSAGQMQLLAESKNEMERLGPNPAVLGRQGADTSGRALLARQQAGLVELALVISQLDDWELRILHQVWYRIKQYWRDKEYIRVTDDPQDPQFVQLNRPKGAMVANDNGEEVEGAPEFNEQGESVFGYENDVAQMDVDIIVDTQPETANIMQEMVADLIKLVSASPAYAEQVPFEMFLELSPLPRKRQVKDMLAKYQATKAKAAQQQQQMQEKAGMAKLEAELEEIKSIVFKNIATGHAAISKVEQDDQAGHTAAQEAATYAAETFHGAVTDHRAQDLEEQRLELEREAAAREQSQPEPAE